MHLPSSLTHLDFGSCFVHPLREWHPPASLMHLTMAMGFAWRLRPSHLHLRTNLQSLTLPIRFNEARKSLRLLHLPSTLRTLTLGGPIKHKDLAALTLPQSLTALDLGDGCDASLDHVVWPPHLTRLLAGQSFKQPLAKWSPPSSLTELTLGDKNGYGLWNHPVSQLRLPSHLQTLRFGSAFNQPLTGLRFPPSLRVLRLGFSFRRSLESSAWSPPEQLEELHLGGKWNRSCTDLHLPTRLRKLTLSNEFNEPIENEQGECSLILPSTLTELRFGHDLPSLTLPPSARLITLPFRSQSFCQV